MHGDDGEQSVTCMDGTIFTLWHIAQIASKTTRPLKPRISEHRSNIRNKDTKSLVAVHFTNYQHNVSSLRYTGIELVKPLCRGGDINTVLLKQETFWIYELDTLSPRGINEDFDIRPFF